MGANRLVDGSPAPGVHTEAGQFRSIRRVVSPQHTALAALLAVLPACTSPPPAPPADPVHAPPPAATSRPPAPGRSPESGPPVERELPEGWSAVAPVVFEEIVDGLAGGRFTWTDDGLDELARALDRVDETSVRAAVLLAHARGDGPAETLLARLERRGEAAVRAHDAGDLVAAAALAGRGRAGAPARLEALAVGPRPHPDLEVRVECARSALASGRDAVIPFLVRVLRALTPAERDDPPDWERVTTMSWAKHRAAEALAARAGVACEFRPDGSWEHQMSEAARLEALLRGGGGTER